MSTATPGKRLYGTTSTAEIIVVKGAEVSLVCAGAPMTDTKPDTPATPSGDQAIALGKRYTDPESGLVVLCTKPGAGPLIADGRELELQATKPLPSSD
jgi:hypothetical protein